MVRRPGPDIDVSLIYVMFILYCAAAVDDDRLWHCDCGARIHHRIIAYRRMTDFVRLFMLEVEKCSVGSWTSSPGV